MNLFTKLIFVNFADWISPWHRLFTGRLGAQIQGELEVWEDTVMEILRDSPVQSIRCWVWTDNECLQGTCINYKWLKRNCPKFITEQLWIRNTIQPLRRQMWPFKFNGSHSFHTTEGTINTEINTWCLGHEPLTGILFLAAPIKGKLIQINASRMNRNRTLLLRGG